MKSTIDLIDREIRRIELELRGIQEDTARAEPLPARWSYRHRALCWHVVFAREVLEPDIDIELTSRALIVRGRPLRHASRVLIAILPVPRFFDCNNPEIRFEAGFLEITLPRRGHREG